MPQSAGSLRTPGVLRQAPVDPYEQISQLRRRDRHPPILTLTWNGRWPDEAATFQPLGEQAHSLPIVPQHLEQAAPTAAEHEQMAVVRIALQRLLHQQRQTVEAYALMWSST